jgi:branched-chain amino acid transport system substrate-binding protein
MFSRGTKLLVALTAAAVLAACGSSGGSDGSSSGGGGGGEPVPIGVAIPLTGDAATYGQDAQRGYEMARDEINDNGGILGGRQIELVYEDDKGTPEGGVTAVQKLISQRQVSAVTGGTNSSVVLAEASVTKDRILQVNASAQADAITEDGGAYLFQVNNTVTQNGAAFNAYIVDEVKPQSIAYMGEQTAFNAGVLDKLRTDMDEAGIDIVETAEYQADTRDFASILSRMKAAGADALYVADAFPARTAIIMQQVRQIGGFGTILVSPGVVTTSSVQTAGQDINGIITGDIYAPSLDTEANQAFVEKFSARNEGKLPGKGELTSYEALLAIAAAMDEAGRDTDYPAIAKAMNDLELDTPRGRLTFGDKGRASAESFFIQTVEDGELVVLTEVAAS